MGDLVTVNGYVAVAILLLYCKYGTRTTGCAARGGLSAGWSRAPRGKGQKGYSYRRAAGLGIGWACTCTVILLTMLHYSRMARIVVYQYLLYLLVRARNS